MRNDATLPRAIHACGVTHGLAVPMVGEQLITLVIGFLLTTVLGGGLGFFFQRRAWEHQHRVLVEEQERESAARVFEEVSRLLDKRLYRMRLIYWALVQQLKAGEESSAADDQWADYKTFCASGTTVSTAISH